jgi:DNA-binding NtrC family response regulator
MLSKGDEFGGVEQLPAQGAVLRGVRSRILVVEDDANERQGVADLLRLWGHEVETASNGQDALETITSFNPALVIADLKMPNMGGIELLRRIREAGLTTSFMVLTGYGTIEEAVEATKLGAFNFLEKPLQPQRLQVEIRNCLDRQESDRHLEVVRRRLRDLGMLGNLVGRSKAMQEVLALIEQIAPSIASVLIVGESGTGKELAARTIHQLSPRSAAPFVAVNCAAIPESLMESEIFGHEKGAFTGALERRAGCFELADGGTLLLDEIGEMPVPTQAKLLRVLEDSKVRRLGSKSEISVDVRVLAATNKIPEEAVANGKLRNDLYYRLNVVQIRMPALREHLEDLDDIVQPLIENLNRKHNRMVKSVDDEALHALRQYSWPGNVRELRNILERAVVTCSSDLLGKKHLPPNFGQPGPAPVEDGIKVRAGVTIEEVERRLIHETLAYTQNNKTRAAEMLGISIKTLHNKLKEYVEVQGKSDASPKAG